MATHIQRNLKSMQLVGHNNVSLLNMHLSYYVMWAAGV